MEFNVDEFRFLVIFWHLPEWGRRPETVTAGHGFSAPGGREAAGHASHRETRDDSHWGGAWARDHSFPTGQDNSQSRQNLMVPTGPS